MNTKKGMITLTMLILLASSLMVILLFQDIQLSFYTNQLTQRKNYVIRNDQLQQSLILLNNDICENNNFTQTKTTQQPLESQNNIEQKEAIQYYIWCTDKKLFKQDPTNKQAVNQGMFSEFIDERYIHLFENQLVSPPSPLPNDKNNYLFWFKENQTEWLLDGNVNGIIVAEGDLFIRGKGNIKGTIITKGQFNKDDNVRVVYGRSPIMSLLDQYHQWQIGEKSWNDFSN